MRNSAGRTQVEPIILLEFNILQYPVLPGGGVAVEHCLASIRCRLFEGTNITLRGPGQGGRHPGSRVPDTDQNIALSTH